MKSPNPSMNSPRLFRSIRHLCAGAGTLAMLMATGFAADAPAVSLLPNGGFEKDADHDQWPDNWPRLKDNSGWIEESGNHFLRLTSTEPGKMVLLFQQARIPENVRALELSFRMRVSDLKRGKQSWFDARIMMDFKDASGAKLGGAPAPNTGKSTDGWVEKSVSFLIPENARTLDFMPTLFQVESGTFDFDDVVLKPIDPTPLQAAAAAKAEAARKTWAVAEAPQRDKWPQELHVEGRQILTKDGKEIWLQGVNVVSLEWSNKGEQVLQSVKVAIEDWKSNIIRLPVNEEYWAGKGAGDGGGGYRALVDAVVAATANRGAYLLLDLHRFKAPQQVHADFWKDAAARYKDHPAVIFDLFNEPHGTTWEVWRNGGFVEEKGKPGDEANFTTAEEKAKAKLGFQAIGMQALLNAVRGTGAKNVVLVGRTRLRLRPLRHRERLRAGGAKRRTRDRLFDAHLSLEKRLAGEGARHRGPVSAPRRRSRREHRENVVAACRLAGGRRDLGAGDARLHPKIQAALDGFLFSSESRAAPAHGLGLHAHTRVGRAGQTRARWREIPARSLALTTPGCLAKWPRPLPEPQGIIWVDRLIELPTLRTPAATLYARVVFLSTLLPYRWSYISMAQSENRSPKANRPPPAQDPNFNWRGVVLFRPCDRPDRRRVRFPRRT